MRLTVESVVQVSSDTALTRLVVVVIAAALAQESQTPTADPDI